MSLVKVKSRGTDNIGGGRRNLVMNGAMRVAQRGASNGGTSTEGYKLTDRWRQTNDNTSATWNHTQSTDVPSGQGFASSYKIAPGSADTSLASNCQIRLEQRWEGQDLQHLKKGTSNALSTTLSFWVKSVQTGTFVVNLQDTDNSRLIAKTYTVNTTNTWEKKVIHFAGDTTGALTNDNNLSMVLHFYLSAGSDYTSGTLATSWASITNANRAAGQTVDLASSTSNAFYLTGVQWETGDSASDFEHLSYGEELRLCRRYFENSNQTGRIAYLNHTVYTSTSAYCTYFFDVEKRAQPTITHGSSSWRIYQNGTLIANANGTGGTDGIGQRNFSLTLTYPSASFTTNSGGMADYRVNNGILIDAEL